MMVWLDLGVGAPIGVVDGVVPREALARLVSLDEARREMLQRQEVAMRDVQTRAEAHAGQLLDAARAQAAELVARSLREAGAARARGFARGRAEALDAWHAQAAQHRREALLRHVDQRERLAGMVAQAVTALLAQAGAEAFFDAAVAALDGLAEQSRALLLRVHPDDEAAARASIARRGEHWPDGTVVKLVADARLRPRDCVCESPRGLVDASLSLQLAALRRAAAAALRAQGMADDAPTETDAGGVRGADDGDAG
jgi:type III secretion protein L